MTGFRKYRRGDVVSIRAVVQHEVEDGDESVHVKLGGYSRAAVAFDEITGFIQPSVEIDDRVRRVVDGREGVVRAVVESSGVSFLMVETDPAHMETWIASGVEVVVPPPPPAKND